MCFTDLCPMHCNKSNVLLQEHLWDITVVRQESNIEVTAEEHSVFLDR